MNKINHTHHKSARFLAALGGGLVIGLVTIPQAVFAEIPTVSKVNPCPSIFYEYPHNQRVFVPEGCPPNAFTRRNARRGVRVPTVVVPPTPEQIRQGIGGEAPEAIAMVMTTQGRVNVILKNDTNTNIVYQVVGHTGQRSLGGRNKVLLQGLPLPLTITTFRQDGGLLKITPISNNQSGLLGLSLDETTSFRDSRNAITIQQFNGGDAADVFVN